METLEYLTKLFFVCMNKQSQSLPNIAGKSITHQKESPGLPVKYFCKILYH